MTTTKTQEKITFNSTALNYGREVQDLKRNTVRKIDYTDYRFTLRPEPKYIEITCRELDNISFIREITDITDFEGYRIYSW